MVRLLVMIFLGGLLGACVATRAPSTASRASWEQRAGELQKAEGWQLDGRVAVALGTQGWQATINWRQRNDLSEAHLAGPFGIGALVLNRTPAGLSLNGAAPGETVLAQLRERLGFDMPVDHLRYWLLGVPDPGAPFELVRNDHDRALTLAQDGWSIAYDRYMTSAGDVLPALIVATRAGARVRIVVDRWEWQP